MEKEIVYCKKCGNQELVIKGHLTEEGKRDYLCSACKVRDNMPMESKIAEQVNKGKRLLVEG